MKDPELDILINELENQTGLTMADYDGIAHALNYLLPDSVSDEATAPQRISTTDGTMLVADEAYPNWAVHIRGRANDHDGHWRCALRENDSRDSDAAIGAGRSPVLAQAILAAVLRLSMILSKQDSSA